MFVYCFRVKLVGNEKVFRDIEIMGAQTLDDLHDSIFDAFDREDEHLYSFYLTRKAVKNFRRINDFPEFTHPMVFEEDDMYDDDENKHDASIVTIDVLELSEGEHLYYLFDFGDNWWHELSVLEIKEADKAWDYPRIVKKCGESPDQYPDSDDED